MLSFCFFNGSFSETVGPNLQTCLLVSFFNPLFLLCCLLRFSTTVCMAVFLSGLMELCYSTPSESEQEDDISNFVQSFLERFVFGCLGITRNYSRNFRRETQDFLSPKSWEL